MQNTCIELSQINISQLENDQWGWHSQANRRLFGRGCTPAEGHAALPWSAQIHREGRKETALVVTAIASQGASTATCLRAAPLPAHGATSAPDNTMLSLEQLPLLMRAHPLELGAVRGGLGISWSAESMCRTTASLPGSCLVHRSAFTILGYLLQLFSHSESKAGKFSSFCLQS